MGKLVLFVSVMLFFQIITSCEEAKTENVEVKVRVASEKSCVPDAGCAGCPEAYAKATIIPPKEIEEVLKQKPKVIFIELGSAHFKPSQKMQLMMEFLKQKEKEFVSMSESLDTSTAMGRFVMDIIQRIA